MRNKLITALLAALSLWACGDRSSRQSDVYEPTELALLMRQMLEEYGEAKKDLEQGKIPSKKITYVDEIMTAEPTDPADINDLYKALGAPFIAQAKAYASSPNDLKEQIKMHNLTIKSCINCHKSFCGGPIQAIKKLYVVP